VGFLWYFICGMPTRLSRAEQVERNRELVLDAARRVFLDRGYAGATVDNIALEAGFSKGVVYSQFAGKPDLFLALLERRIDERAAENAREAEGKAGLDGLRQLLLVNARRAMDDDSAWPRLLIEFRVVASRDPELNHRYAHLHTRALDQFGGTIQDVLARGGLAPEHPPRVLAELIFALDNGHVLEQAAGTSRLDIGVLVDFVARLVRPI
jgi:AcrR family transcriptional regulator